MIDQIARLIANLIRIGTVIEIDADAARVRIQSGEFETDWLPWLAQAAGDTKQWRVPGIDEQVLILCPNGDLDQGIVLAGLYSTANASPENNAAKTVTEYADGTRIEYDTENAQMTITAAGAVSVTISGDAMIDVGGNLAVSAGGDATVDATSIAMNGGAGVVTQECICHFTGSPHGDASTTVTAGK